MNEDRYKVGFYISPSGKCPMKQFIDTIPVKAQTKMNRWLEMLEDRGPDLPRPYADAITGKIRELRMVFAGQHYRCLYFFDQKRIVVTHGFIKKTDEVPPGEVILAQRLMEEYFK